MVPAVHRDSSLQTPLDYSDNQKACNNKKYIYKLGNAQKFGGTAGL